MPRRLPALLAALALVTVAAPAAAQDHDSYVHRPADVVDVGGLTVWGILAYGGGIGAGAHYMIPVGDAGILQGSGLKDRFALEFGADIVSYTFHRYWAGTWTRLRPAVGFLWTIWLQDNLAVYPKLDAGWSFWFGGSGTRTGTTLHLLNGSLGLLYRMDSFDLRVEAGWFGLHGGAVFRF
jgi:hypothetical protein